MTRPRSFSPAAAKALIAMSGMLNTLLDINQLEAGVIRPEIVDFPIDDLLENLKTEFGYHTRAKGLDLRVLPCRSAVQKRSAATESG